MGSASVKEEPEEALGGPAAMPAPQAPSAAPASGPQGADPALIAAVEGDAAEASSPQGEAVPAAAADAAAVVPAPQEQALALNNSLLQDIKSALLDVRFDMGAYRQEADEMKDTMRAMRDEQETLKEELAALKAAQQTQQAQQAPAAGDVQGQLLAALLGSSPMGSMLADMLAGGNPAAKKTAAGKRKVAAAGGGAARKRNGSDGGAAAAAAAAAAAEAEAQKRAAALRQKREPWVVERADGTRGTWPADVADEELQTMLAEFQEGPLKAAISYTRVAQSAHFRHSVLAVPHKKSADGELLYYIKRASLIGEAKRRGLAV